MIRPVCRLLAPESQRNRQGARTPQDRFCSESHGVQWRFGATIRAASLAASVAISANADPLAQCRELELADREGGRNCFRDLLTDPSPALRAEAAWALGDIQTANALFRSATQSVPDDAAVRVRWGELFLSTYQVADAEALFAEALAIDADNVAAKLGLARVALGRFEARAKQIVESVLAGNPDHVEANLLAARLALEVGDTERARRSLQSPLAAKDVLLRLEGMALAAALDHMLGAVPSDWETEALKTHPGYGKLFETVAHFYIITRRYREAIAQLERAVAVDPELWSAHAALGINLLRVNRFDEGRRILAKAHDGDPYNVEVVNTLRLLDSLDGWGVLVHDDVILRIHPDESGALATYVKRLVTDAVAIVGERYGFVPDYPGWWSNSTPGTRTSRCAPPGCRASASSALLSATSFSWTVHRREASWKDSTGPARSGTKSPTW